MRQGRGNQSAGPGRSRRRTAAACAVVAVALAVAVGAAIQSPGRGLSRLQESGVAQDPCQPREALPVPPATAGRFEPDSSVLVSAAGVFAAPGKIVPLTAARAACISAAVLADRDWLSSGTVPGSSAAQRALATRALLDLRLAVRPNGAVVAGWSAGWEYVWPRDASWAAVALAGTGHAGQAYQVLRFLQREQPRDGIWAARYWPDGSGPVLDGRAPELDAVGWVPWAAWSWYVAARRSDPAQALGRLRALWPMVQRAADAAVRSLSSGLPGPSMDYWENSSGLRTIETAAALEAGLRSAAGLATAAGQPASGRRWAAAAGMLATAIGKTFGQHGFQRTAAAGSGYDAAVTFLGPPFEPASPAVVQAARKAAAALRLPGGGVVPGTQWHGFAGMAWTPETLFFALLDAETGRPAAANQVLSWLAAHQTRLGELPEQVNRDGKPVSVAPLTWTDSLVLGTLLAEARRLPAVPGVSGAPRSTSP
jgi:glucoamylase